MKVLVAIPALDTCATDFAMSLASMLTHITHDKRLRREVPLALACAKGSIIPHSRNLLMQQAIDAGASHILFLDSDMTFPPDTLARLIGHGKPMVGADYVNRVPPHALNGRPSPTAVPGSPLIPMLTMPFGVMLISLKVLADMPRPFFRYIEGIDDSKTLSEDTYFCNAARHAGHTIWCDAALSREVGHVGISVFRAGT